MAVIKIYCSRCGQRVSGDETFCGTTVHCPTCGSEIHFPKAPHAGCASPAPAAGPEGGAASGAGAPVSIPPPPGGVHEVFPPSKPLSGGGVTTPMPRHPHLHNLFPPGTPASLPAAPGALPPAVPGATPSAAGGMVPPPGPEMPGGQPLLPAPAPLASPAVTLSASAPLPGEGLGRPEEPGILPAVALWSGIASMFLFGCFLIPSAVAIVTGHLALMKLHDAGIQEGRSKALTGTLLGYVSALLFLVLAVAVKFLAGPAIQNWLHGG